jgi:tyrosyl-tRNA synthetase
MLMGRELLRKYKNKEKFVLSTPIINGTDGRKMSKSYGNFVALNAKPNEMFGKLMSVKDEEMEQYFEIFTDLESREFLEMIKNSPRDAKVLLAKTIVSWLHTPEDAEKAYQDFQTKFVKKEIPDEMPEFKISREIGILDLISKTCNFAKSNGEARRLIVQGAVSLDGEKVSDPNFIVQIPVKKSVLKVGKRKFARII